MAFGYKKFAALSLRKRHMLVYNICRSAQDQVSRPEFVKMTSSLGSFVDGNITIQDLWSDYDRLIRQHVDVDAYQQYVNGLDLNKRYLILRSFANIMPHITCNNEPQTIALYHHMRILRWWGMAPSVFGEMVKHITRTPPQESLISVTAFELAQALYQEQGHAAILADALEECGNMQLATHFRFHPDHPKGCAALDLILGK